MPLQPLLFAPWKLGDLQLNNRIVIPPMCMYSATSGAVSAFHHMHIGTMATSGAGLVILEATAVRPEGRITPHCCGLWDDTTAAALKTVLDEVRQYSSTPIAIQLAHAGRKASCHVPFARDGLAGKQIPPSAPDGWQTVGPSDTPFAADEHPPHALTVDEIHDITEAFAAAARRADAIGIAGVELHFAHGYLAHSFLSPLSNERTDEYGGSLENRLRMPLEVFRAVRAAFPANKPVWVRISATDWVEGGWDEAQSIALSKELKALGCAAIHVSSGGLAPQQQIPVRAGYQLPLARAIRDAAQMPVIGVGLIMEAEEAEVALAAGAADAIAIGRQFLYEPRWAYIAAHRLRAKVVAPPQYWRCEPAPQTSIFKQAAQDE